MNVMLYTLPDKTGAIQHLAVKVGDPFPDIAWLLGAFYPTDKTVELERGVPIAGINVDTVLNGIDDRGWAVLGSGFSP